MESRNPWHFEPVAIGAAVRSIVLLCSVFWWHLDADKLVLVQTSAEAVLAVFTRQSVLTPATVHQAGQRVSDIVETAKQNRDANPQ